MLWKVTIGSQKRYAVESATQGKSQMSVGHSCEILDNGTNHMEL